MGTRKLFIAGLCAFALQSNSQGAGKEPENGVPIFYGRPVVGVIASQIDGDNASGYNKFGYQLGMLSGFRWAELGFGAIEMQMGIAERGSRRAFNPLTFEQAFHIRTQQLELKFGGVGFYSLPEVGAIQLLAGMRYCRLLNVQEMEGFNPGIANDFRKNSAMLELGIGKSMGTHIELRATVDFGISSLVRSNFRSVFFPTGVYHNGVAVSVLWKLEK